MNLSPFEIAARVPMPDLLRYLGLEVNERSRRGRCQIHRGENPTAFSWTPDGRWHCFACGRGGDKYDLIQALLHCGFGEALQVMASLAGAEIKSKGTRRILSQHREEQHSLDRAARHYEYLERDARTTYANWLRTLDALEELSAKRLGQLLRGSPVHSPQEETDLADAFHLALDEKPSVAAAFFVLSFASEEERQRFVIYSAERQGLIDRVLEQGGVRTDDGHFVEIVL